MMDRNYMCYLRQDYVCKFRDVRHREISSNYLSKNKVPHVLYLIHKRLQGRKKKSVIVLYYKFTYKLCSLQKVMKLFYRFNDSAVFYVFLPHYIMIKLIIHDAH
jgi:hypothetical protein